ncbi:MAG: TIGR01212 family radical SAM protein [Lachnospiraceae bacterium]|nr:TIGR01212 family radical SAM protein [Lachnospiraceae bacterium]
MIEDINLLNGYMKRKYGRKLYKLALDGGMSCPNRDGTKGRGGCIFCSGGGSGEFAADRNISVTEQISEAKKRIEGKLPKSEETGYIAYFQAFTNTYGSVDYLERIFTEAIENETIDVLSIATRPDCLEDDKLELLGRLNRLKPVMIELGLQTADENTAVYINRGYENQVFEKAVKRLKEKNIEVVVHLIIGLPGEDKAAFLKTIDYVNSLPVDGVKLQLLHILEGTVLAEYYKEGKADVLSMEEYTDILTSAIKRLRKDIVIHRMTGDGPKKILVAPEWSRDKKKVLNTINKFIRDNNIIQGDDYYGS